MFDVKPESLAHFATALDGRAGETSVATAYATRHLSLPAPDPLVTTYALAQEAVARIRDALTAAMAQLGVLCVESASEVRASAQAYLRTDDKEDQRLDATYASRAPR